MIFNPNQTKFQNEYQQEVWRLGIHIVPPEVSLAEIQDDAVKAGCMEMYDCIMALFTHMYESPEKYAHTGPLDYLLFALEWMTGKRKFPAAARRKKGYFEKILDNLKPFGFLYDGSTVVNFRYPNFIKYWLLVHERSNPMYCDFRVLNINYKPSQSCTRDDLLRPLSDQNRKCAAELYDYALSIGAKRMPYNQYRPYCMAYHKKHILVLNNEHGLTASVPYKNQYTSADTLHELHEFMILAEHQADHDELIAYIQNEIMLCKHCNSAGCGIFTTLASVQRQIAGCRPEICKNHEPSVFCQYTEYDVKMMKRLMDVRLLQIQTADVTNIFCESSL